MVGIIVLYVIVIFLIFYKFNDTRERQIVFWVLFLCLWLTASFRDGNLFRDYTNYLEMYKNLSVRVEPTFFLIVHFVKSTFNDVVFLFIFYAFLGISIKFKAIQELSTEWFLCLLIYVSNFYLLHDMVQMRVGVASALLLLSIKPLYDRNWRRFFLYASIAALFHYSALVILFLWFLNPKKLNIAHCLILLLLGATLHIWNIHFSSLARLIPIESVQLTVDLYFSFGENAPVFAITKYIFLFLILYKIDTIYKYNKYAYLLVKIYVSSLLVLILMSDVSVLAIRLHELLGIVEIVLLPLIIYCFKSAWQGKVVLLLISMYFLYYKIFSDFLIPG